MPAAYYALHAPKWLREDPRRLTPLRREELDRFGAACRIRPGDGGTGRVPCSTGSFPARRMEEIGRGQLETDC